MQMLTELPGEWLVSADVQADLILPRLGTHTVLNYLAIRPRGYSQIKRNDWLPADMCPQSANHCIYFEFETVLKFCNLEA